MIPHCMTLTICVIRIICNALTNILPPINAITVHVTLARETAYYGCNQASGPELS